MVTLPFGKVPKKMNHNVDKDLQCCLAAPADFGRRAIAQGVYRPDRGMDK
jgi:hypothetical protein